MVVAKEVFGGTGRNFLERGPDQPCFPVLSLMQGQISGDKVWTAVDGFSGATALGQMANANPAADAANPAVASLNSVSTSGTRHLIDPRWISVSRMPRWKPGRMLPGHDPGLHWRDQHPAVPGRRRDPDRNRNRLVEDHGRRRRRRVCDGLVDEFGQPQDTNPMLGVPSRLAHGALADLAFGLVYMATDPVSASMTEMGKVDLRRH